MTTILVEKKKKGLRTGKVVRETLDCKGFFPNGKAIHLNSTSTPEQQRQRAKAELVFKKK